jgi:hypothetical protein
MLETMANQSRRTDLSHASLHQTLTTYIDAATYTTAQATLYNKVFPLSQREIHRKTLEQQAGLELRDQRTRHTENRKKRKFGDTIDEMNGIDDMGKMRMGLPTFTFGAGEEVEKVVGKSHDGLVVYNKGKGKEKNEEIGEEKARA